MKFNEKLSRIVDKNSSLVCVGLDSEMALLPAHLQDDDDPQFAFNKAIIDATADLVCAYKPNIAFYEAEGIRGMQSLQKTLEYIPDHIPVILDAKRGDIGNTSRLYAKAYFEELDVDAVTIHAYMGTDTVSPFLEYEDKAIFVLVKTSNASAPEIEDLEVTGGKPVYLYVAGLIRDWNEKYPGLAGAVVGATYPDDLKPIRLVLPDVPFLIPGLGRQGGDAEKTVRNGVDARGGNAIINSSRGIIFASSDTDFADAAREKTLALRERINSYR